jgi:ABC-type glycerol-3-phosphate transport system substrate-binding protein
MKNMSLFQGVFLGIAIISGIVGILLFATFKGTSKTLADPVTVWGFYPDSDFREIILGASTDEAAGFANLNHITYVEKNPETFDREFVEALATGQGPGVIFVDHDAIFRNWNKVVPVSYETYSERVFQETYIQGADVTRDLGGIRAFPVIADPLVMYWNQDIFTSAGIAQPPKTWTEFLSIVPELSDTDELGTVYKSGVALGEYDNITYAKDIITTLILQSGNQIVRKSEEVFDDGSVLVSYDSVLSLQDQGQILQPAENALKFYAQYSDPSRDLYSWNKSLGNDQDLFLQGEVAIYLGKASDYPKMKRRNPNLNFDVAPLPQRSGSNKLTVADYDSLAVVQNGKDLNANYGTLQQLLIPAIHAKFAEKSGLPPTRRDLLSFQQPQAQIDIFYESALYSTAFLDMVPDRSGDLFEEMLESYTTGLKGVSGAIGDTSEKLNVLLKGFEVQL